MVPLQKQKESDVALAGTRSRPRLDIHYVLMSRVDKISDVAVAYFPFYGISNVVIAFLKKAISVSGLFQSLNMH